MLARPSRLHRAPDFTAVLRGGRRASRPTLTVHLLVPDLPQEGEAESESTAMPRAGLVVSKVVGGSVVRSTVSRRLRHLLRDRLPDFPAGTRIVVRAAPAAATASSLELGDDLDAALARARAGARAGDSGRAGAAGRRGAR